MNFFNDLTTTQWAVLAAAIALLAFPRLGGIKTWITGLLAKVKPASTTSAPTIHAKVDAYQTLAGDLPVDLAKQVWACIQEPPGIEPSVMPATKTED